MASTCPRDVQAQSDAMFEGWRRWRFAAHDSGIPTCIASSRSAENLGTSIAIVGQVLLANLDAVMWREWLSTVKATSHVTRRGHWVAGVVNMFSGVLGAPHLGGFRVAKSIANVVDMFSGAGHGHACASAPLQFRARRRFAWALHCLLQASRYTAEAPCPPFEFVAGCADDSTMQRATAPYANKCWGRAQMPPSCRYGFSFKALPCDTFDSPTCT